MDGLVEVKQLLETQNFNDSSADVLENYLLPLKREYVKVKQEVVKYLIETKN